MNLLLEVGKTDLINIEKGAHTAFSKDELRNKVIAYHTLSLLERENPITRILLVDLSNNPVSSDDLSEYTNNLYFFEELTGFVNTQMIVREKKFLSNLEIFNKLDLTVKDGEQETLTVARFSNFKGVKVGFSPFLTPFLAHILMKIEDSEIYARSYFDVPTKGITKTVKIDDPKKFLSFYLEFERLIHSSFESYNNIPQLFTEAFVLLKRVDNPILDQRLFDQAFRNMVDRKNSRLILVGGDKYLSNKFILEIQGKLGIFDNIDCSESLPKIKIKKEGVVLHNIDKLSYNKRVEILSQLTNWKNKKKIVILTAASPIDDLSLYGFSSIRVPTYDDCKNYLNVFLALMMRDKKMFVGTDILTDRIYFLELLKANCLNELLQKFPSLSEMDETLEELKHKQNVTVITYHADFWYGFQQYINNKYECKSNEQKINIPEEQADSNAIQTTHEEGKFIFKKKSNNKFQIVFDGAEIELKNDGKIGLKYIYQIIKYARSTPISLRDLDNLCNKQQIYQVLKSSINDEDVKQVISGGKTNNKGFYDVLDREGITSIKARVNELENKLKKIPQTNTRDRNKIAEEIKEIKKYFNDSTQSNGKPKKLDDKNEKIKNLQKSIKKAIDDIKKEIQIICPEFYSFLDKRIIYNNGEYSYSYLVSDAEITNYPWILE